MARQLAVLALIIFVAIDGLVADELPSVDASLSPADAPVTAISASSTEAPVSSPPVPGPDSEIGAIGDSDPDETAEEAPVGGPVPIEAFGPSATAAVVETPKAAKNGATTLEVSAIAGVAAVAGFFF